jgi:hypothetical protein
VLVGTKLWLVGSLVLTRLRKYTFEVNGMVVCQALLVREKGVEWSRGMGEMLQLASWQVSECVSEWCSASSLCLHLPWLGLSLLQLTLS